MGRESEGQWNGEGVVGSKRVVQGRKWWRTFFSRIKITRSSLSTSSTGGRRKTYSRLQEAVQMTPVSKRRTESVERTYEKNRVYRDSVVSPHQIVEQKKEIHRQVLKIKENEEQFFGRI